MVSVVQSLLGYFLHDSMVGQESEIQTEYAAWHGISKKAAGCKLGTASLGSPWSCLCPTPCQSHGQWWWLLLTLGAEVAVMPVVSWRL